MIEFLGGFVIGAILFFLLIVVSYMIGYHFSQGWHEAETKYKSLRSHTEITISDELWSKLAMVFNRKKK